MVGFYKETPENPNPLITVTVPTFKAAVALVRSVDYVDGEPVVCSYCHSSGHHAVTCADRPPVREMK